MLEELKERWLSPGETLVCFGDSITAAPEGYVGLLEEKLAADNIKVVNSGLPGDKTPAALTRLISDVVSHKPDAVSIYFGANDAAIGRGIWSDEPVTSEITYRDNLIWMVHLLRKHCDVKKICIATPMPRFEGNSYRLHGDILRGYTLMAREAVDRSRTLLIPLDFEFESLYALRANQFDPESGLLFTRDGVHPTAEGYRIIADAFLKAWKML